MCSPAAKLHLVIYDISLSIIKFVKLSKLPLTKVVQNGIYPPVSGGLCPPDPLLFCFYPFGNPLSIFLPTPLPKIVSV